MAKYNRILLGVAILILGGLLGQSIHVNGSPAVRTAATLVHESSLQGGPKAEAVCGSVVGRSL